MYYYCYVKIGLKKGIMNYFKKWMLYFEFYFWPLEPTTKNAHYSKYLYNILFMANIKKFGPFAFHAEKCNFETGDKINNVSVKKYSKDIET